jgi:hypothetical protein
VEEVEGRAGVVARVEAIIKLVRANGWDEVHWVRVILVVLVVFPVWKLFPPRLVAVSFVFVALLQYQ